jgi:Flp pilus assembly protein TadG
MSVPRRYRRRDEVGATAILVALFFSFIALPLGAVTVDVARLYVELERVQAAADAAATAGVTFMPDDFAKAKARAIEIAEDNGFPNSGTSSVQVAVGAKPTQLKVTVSSTVRNAFARAFGVSTSTMARTAVADFNGPAPMGSPCNTFGNEPVGGSNRGTSSSSLLSKPPLAQCDSNPQFWANIGGPGWPKGNGDQYMTRTCSGVVDGCTGTRNDEFDPRGYFYIVRVNPGAVGRLVKVELYDPAFVAVGDFCQLSPTGNVTGNAWNAYTRTDSIERYRRQSEGDTNSMCTGDVMSGSVPTVTSFGLRGPTITNDPRQAPPITSCARQYPGYAQSAVTAANIQGSGGSRTGATPNDNLTKVFRQWVPFCSFTPPVAGDYYLQVRTNVRLSTASPDGEGGYAGNQAVFNQAGDDTSVGGDGANRYAIRAHASGSLAGSLSVSAYERMPIYANASGADTTFNLVRVVPAAASKMLVFSFFDVGEGANGGTMRVIPPSDSNMGSTIGNCTANGYFNGNLSNCQISNISSTTGWNGRSQNINVPIPENYTCTTADPGGCWFRVVVDFGPGRSVNDSTTWTAAVDGEPVRLIE